MQYFTINQTKEFITIIKISNLTPTNKDIDELLYKLSECARQNRVWIVDLQEAKLLSAEHRICCGNWLKRDQEVLKKNVPGWYLIVSSVMVEISLKGIFLISKPPVPYQVGSSSEQAWTWAEQRKQNMKLRPSTT